MNKKFVKGAAILTITTFLSKILGSFFQIPLQNIAGDEVLGIFRLVFPVYMIALTLSVAGVPLAISQLTAELYEKNDDDGIAKLFTSASIIGVIFGGIGFLVIIMGSSTIAELLGGQETRLALIITSFALLIAPYMAVYRGYFQGFGDMVPTGVSQVIEQLIRVFFMLTIAYVFVYSNESSDIVTGGAMIGSCLGVISSLVYLRVKYVKSSYRYKANTYSIQDFKRNAIRILRVSVPIAIGALSMPVLNLIDSVTIPHLLEESSTTIQEQFGIYSRGFAFTQLIIVFASAMIFPLIPILTSALTKKDMGLAKLTVQRVNELAHVLTMPLTVWLMALTVPLNVGLFTDTKGSSMIAVLIGSSYFASFMVLSIGILQGINRSMQAAWIVIGASFIKIVLNIALVSKFGISGAAYSTLMIYIMICIVNYMYIRKNFAYPVHIRRFFAVVGVSCILGIGLYLVSTMLHIMDSRFLAIIYSVAALSIASLLYGVCALKMNWISKKQIPFLRK
ncbi:polysaccharide biosynthesis protein [Bacillus clarus]|uniref:Polysaccharide biosynthesis family protein n=1 Tax=Bacillus clarus TaxID=2338372 RepID=A0A090ZGM3_9BACI|nr:polysaccharide biosynthesis protein [Bacillus clarus]KFN03391.1 polysaccharide biosynthesis family protein [Bacillus clarus]RFT68014.1 polysaccharide biosynthesis protein [Bacillus clarus]